MPYEDSQIMTSDIVMNPLPKEGDVEQGDTSIVKIKDPRIINRNLFDYHAKQQELEELAETPADVLARAFADDYMIKTWPGVGLDVESKQKRIDNSKVYFLDF